MAGYGYAYRGSHTTYSQPTDGWSKTSYSSDRVYQPVIVDAEGRRKPVISYTPNGNTEYYVTTEVIEPVPLVTGYKQSTPVRVEVLREYGDGEGKWNRPSSPEKWPTVHEPPQQVEDFLTKIQTEASRPNNNRLVPPSGTNWHQKPNSYHVNTGYGDHGDLSNKEWQRPIGNTFRNESYDSTYAKPSYRSWSPPQKGHLSKPTNDINTAMDHLTEAVKPSSGVTKPSHGAWSTPQGANLGKPISDINTAVEYLKEPVKPSSGITPQPYRSSIPVTLTGPKRYPYPETIDSREAERRYGNLNFASSRPVDNYTKTIDSREAARKYGGTMV